MDRQPKSAAAALGAALLAVAVMAIPAPAPAQYLYLDTNGDGVHTDADVIAPSGPTTANVWLCSNANRDGTPVVCPSGQPLDIWDYIFVLKAVGGTITWGSFANNPANSLPFHQASTPTEFYSGICSVPRTDPGLYRLATLTFAVETGTPSLLVVPNTTLWPPEQTGFGTSCDGNTLLLGRDWFDTDGARYGGWTDPPSLAQPAAMTISEAETADQTLTVTDPDGSAVTVSLLSGPGYLSLHRQGTGPSAIWSVHAAPGYFDAGDSLTTLQASDGTGMDFRSFPIHVRNVNRAPVLALPASVFVQVGQSKHLRFTAADPDNDALALTSEGLPSYARLYGPWSGKLDLSLAPAEDQKPETTTVVITVSDGSLSASSPMQIQVGPIGFNPVPLQVRVTPNPMRAEGALAFGTRYPGPLRVSLFDLRGRVVRTLYQSSNAPAADYRIPIPLSRYGGFPSGVYVYRIEGVDGVRTGKLVVLRGSR